MKFEPMKHYRRKEYIHHKYGGQQRGGIATPKNHPAIFIFTGESGEQYGYKDEFRPDGTFWYTGEGQKGDMRMIKGNKAIRDHQENGKTIYLFEYVSSGVVRFIGEANFLADHVNRHPKMTHHRRPILTHLMGLV